MHVLVSGVYCRCNSSVPTTACPGWMRLRSTTEVTTTVVRLVKRLQLDEAEQIEQEDMHSTGEGIEGIVKKLVPLKTVLATANDQ